MPIGKMDMKLIDNEKTRMLTFERRKSCLFKKAYELSVLCDVDVCVVTSGCLSADQRNDRWQTWPEKPAQVGRIIRKFELKKSMANASSVPVQRQENAGEKSEFPLWDSRIDSFSHDQLLDLLEVLDKKLAAVDERITALQTTQVNELPIIDFSSEEEKITNEYFTVHGRQTGQSEMDWIDNLNLDNPFLPDFPLNDELFDDLPTEPSKEILQSEKFHSLPEPVNHSMAVNLPMEPVSEKGHMLPEHTCLPKQMDYYYSIAAGEPSQWSSLSPLPNSIASWPDFPLNNGGCIRNQIQYIPMKPELEKSVEQSEHDGCTQMGYYPIAVNARTRPSELPPLPYASTSAMAFPPPSDISWPGFCGGDYYFQTNNGEEDLFLKFNDIRNRQWY